MPKFMLPKPTDINIPAEKSFTILIDAWRDYKKTCEVEETKRSYISAQRDISLAKIQSQRAILEKYLENTFAERRFTITEMFDRLDKGIESGNDTLIAMSMNAIVSTVKSSPLAGVQNIISQIDDPTVDAIEI